MSPSSGQNDGWKKPLKLKLTEIRKQNVDSYWSWPAEHEFMHIECFFNKTYQYSGLVGVKIEQRVHNKMTECSFNALAFLFIPSHT